VLVSADRLVTAFTVVNLLATVASALAAGVAWRRRRATPAAVALGLLMTAIAVWCGVDLVIGLAVAGHLPETAARVALGAVIPLVAVTVAAVFVISRSISSPGWTPRRRVIALLAVHPMVMTTAVLTNPWTEALYRVHGIDPGQHWFVWTPAWMFFFPHMVYSYGMLLWSFVALARTWRAGSPLQRRQAGAVLIALLIPGSVNLVLEIAGPGTMPDLTAVAFTATGTITAHALLRRGLLRLVPIARGLVLERLQDAVIVLDTNSQVLDVNLAGDRLVRALAPHLTGPLVGMPAREILRSPTSPDLLAAGEHAIDLPDGRLVLDVRIEPLMDARGRPIGRVFAVRDVTELAELRAHLADQAIRDELTGLFNRRHLLTALDRELELADRDGHDVCALMMDVDHFKSVNDDHGHAVGDALLVAISQALSGSLRSGDVLARHGGEEFVVLLPATILDQALGRARELRLRCSSVEVAAPSGPVRRTISIGVASARLLAAQIHPGPGTRTVTASELLRAADEAMYAAKTAGRDRVVAAAAFGGPADPNPPIPMPRAGQTSDSRRTSLAPRE
jgi:diguanylate cyclase (GGDEF)-like protein